MVLCVDRDDDIGEKAGMNGPILGRENVLDAAIALGLADPEDSDTNTILGGLSMYDDLVRKGIDAEVAVISGDRHVGFTSDQIMITQLENILSKVEPSSVVLVSDGAEDEYIYPMVSSRTKVDSIRRVFVKQSKSIESFYYMITKSLTETKTRNRIYIPIGMVLLIYATLVFTGYQKFAMASIFMALGLYILWVTMDITNRSKKGFKSAKESVFEGRVVVPFALIAMVVGIIGVVSGIRAAYTSEVASEMVMRGIGIAGGYIIWGIIIYEAGVMIDVFMRRGRMPVSFWFMNIALIGVALAVLFSIDWVESLLDISRYSLFNYLISQIAATSLLLVSAMVYWFIRRKSGKEEGAVTEEEEEPETLKEEIERLEANGSE